MSEITGGLTLLPAPPVAGLHQVFGKDEPDERAHRATRSDRSAALPLKDPPGRDRVEMAVSAGESPRLELLDDQGKVMAKSPKEAR